MTFVVQLREYDVQQQSTDPERWCALFVYPTDSFEVEQFVVGDGKTNTKEVSKNQPRREILLCM